MVVDLPDDDPRSAYTPFWVDTFAPKPNGGCSTVRMRMADFYGVYVMHCHILTHEDRGMMTSIVVKPRNATAEQDALLQQSLDAMRAQMGGMTMDMGTAFREDELLQVE